jgi:hypothetical protein
MQQGVDANFGYRGRPDGRRGQRGLQRIAVLTDQ